MSKRNKDIALDLYTGDGWVNIRRLIRLLEQYHYR